jgi:hypothetical protein
MKLPEIKRLAEAHTVAELALAKEAILQGEQPQIAVEGEDEGEQLTHVMAAQWIHAHMAQEQVDLRTAQRVYGQMVRKSLS